ncbi:hypothetical protein BD408DRAFT_411565 [Parasitella parasitica]|nr:hypothetical protein BD408DRAFT_411565 [Parasitella parasitica]
MLLLLLELLNSFDFSSIRLGFLFDSLVVTLGLAGVGFLKGFSIKILAGLLFISVFLTIGTRISLGDSTLITGAVNTAFS